MPLGKRLLPLNYDAALRASPTPYEFHGLTPAATILRLLRRLTSRLNTGNLKRCFTIGWQSGFRGPWCFEHANADTKALFRELALLRDMLRDWMEA